MRKFCTALFCTITIAFMFGVSQSSPAHAASYHPATLITKGAQATTATPLKPNCGLTFGLNKRQSGLKVTYTVTWSCGPAALLGIDLWLGDGSGYSGPGYECFANCGSGSVTFPTYTYGSHRTYIVTVANDAGPQYRDFTEVI